MNDDQWVKARSAQAFDMIKANGVEASNVFVAASPEVYERETGVFPGMQLAVRVACARLEMEEQSK
jgi:hypothetical protein